MNVDMEKADERIREIAGKHGIDHTILMDVVMGLSMYGRQKDIAENYNLNKNTVSKYVGKIKDDFSTNDIVETMMITGLIEAENRSLSLPHLETILEG